MPKKEVILLISVIVTTYKRKPEMLNRAIRSVLAQTYKDFELIVVDDSPADFAYRNDVNQLIESLDIDNVRYVQHKENQGACAARNTGIRLSKGEYIAFLDDDDEWLHNKLELQIKEFSHSKIGLVYCDNFKINTIKNKKIHIKHQGPKKGEIISQLLTYNFIGSTSFPLIRKECFDECGLFDPTMVSAQDLEMWLRIVEKYEVAHVKVPLANYYVHGEERITTNPNLKIQANKEMNLRYQKYLEQDPKLYNIRLLNLATHYTSANENTLALKSLIKGLKASPFAFRNNLHFSTLILKFKIRKFLIGYKN